MTNHDVPSTDFESEQGESLKLSVEQVRELLDTAEEREQGKTNVFGREEIKKALGFEILESEIPPISYSKERLDQARQRNEKLVLRVSHDAAGNAMTMKHIHEMVGPQMEATGEGKVLNGVDWYANKAFYTSDSLKTEWRLVSKDVVPGSKGKDYVDQTKILRDYLKSVGDLTPQEEAEVSDEKLKKIHDVMEDESKIKGDWTKKGPVRTEDEKAPGALEDLLINKNHRRTMAEAGYDFIVQLRNSGDRQLEGTFDWTNSRNSDGDFIYFGDSDPNGATVGRAEARDLNESIGVVSAS